MWSINFRKEDTILIGLELLAGYLHKRDAVEKVMVANEWFDDFSSVVNDITVDYICGFFDADGSVFISGRDVVRVAFSNKNFILLSDIRDFFSMNTKIYVMTHNNLPDYQLSTEKRAKVLSILEALESGSVKRHDAVVSGILRLNK